MWKSYVESLEAGRAGNGMEAAGSGGGIFGLLRTISYFTYEMIDRQGKALHDAYAFCFERAGKGGCEED